MRASPCAMLILCYFVDRYATDMASKITVDPSDLSCSICQEVFNDPRALPCLHNICYGCLKEWMKKSTPNTTICCPLCKEVNPVPSGGRKAIKYNYFLADLAKRKDTIDVKSSYKGVQDTKEDIKLSEVTPFYCKAHPRNPIDQYCVDCDFVACGTCSLLNHSQQNLVDKSRSAKNNYNTF